MKLFRPSEVSVRGSGLLCRQSRLMGLIGAVLLIGAFGGAPVLWWFLEAPWPVWGLCAVVAVFVVPFALGDLAAKFRSSNWRMSIRPDGVWINLRSYHNDRLPEAPTVLFLDYDEIAGASAHTETYTTPGGHRSGSTRWKQTYLDLQLKGGQTPELQSALKAEREREGAERVYLGFIRVKGKAKHYPVSLPSENCLRVAWRGGHGNSVAPSVERALEELSISVQTAPRTQRKRADWSELSEAELDELIRDLARAGATIDAVDLLVRRRGYSTTEASKMVDALATE